MGHRLDVPKASRFKIVDQEGAAGVDLSALVKEIDESHQSPQTARHLCGCAGNLDLMARQLAPLVSPAPMITAA